MVGAHWEKFMRALFVAAALALFSAPALAQTTPVAAPLPDRAVAVTAEDNGRTVDVDIGTPFVAVQLQRNPSAGTSWSVAAQPNIVNDPEQLSGPTVTSSRPIMGAPVWQVFAFPMTTVGQGEITLEKKDRAGAVIETFSVNIRVVIPTPAQ